MRRNALFILTLVVCVKVCGGQIKHKMFVGSNNTGQYRISILPFGYDSTVSDIRILQCIDSLPGRAFHSKMYNLIYKDDSTRMAIQVNEGAYLFHVRYEVVEYYKNGAVKRRTYYNKHLKKYWEFDWYEDASAKAKGSYKTITGYMNVSYRDTHLTHSVVKKDRWQYFNADGNLIKREWYATDGTVKKSKDYNPAKRTFITIMNPKHPKGMPYIIQ